MKQLIFIFFCSFALFSCKKDTSTPPPATEISRDSLLVSNIWQGPHIRVLQNNTMISYDRGGSDNTFNYDHDYLEFKKDGTGTYSAGNDVYNISWRFDNAAKTEMSYTLFDYADGAPHDGINLELKLENVFLSENSFRYAEI